MNNKPTADSIGIEDAYDVMEKIKREAKSNKRPQRPGKANPPRQKPVGNAV